ncbi:MAG TPA: late competence development ComFB family protein [Cellvibrio sp.]|nr:late competence development ComFB family protein [Cellvibrio sp.]
MLTNRPYILDDEVDFLHNYYEKLVVQEVHDQSERVQQGDRDFLADVACVALNRLPPRYIRHDVDMTFFMSPQDIVEIERKVTQAVTDALSYVESRERGESTKLPPVEVSLISTRGDKPTKAEKSGDKNKADEPKSAKTPAKTKSPKKKG